MTQPFDVLGSDAPLIVYIDIKSPYAFVAKDPTYALADKLNIDIDWRPLTLDIPSYLGSAKLDKQGKVAESTRTPEQWGGVRYAYMDARRYASAWGYGLRGTEKIWDTRLIHLAFEWVKRADPGGRAEVRHFLDSVYPRFWLRDLDVEDLQVVMSQIELVGVSAKGFADWAADEGGRQHDERQAAIFAAGIYGVPGYIFNREYFFGREHLPHLQSLLEGHAPGAVDVGYPLPESTAIDALGDGKHSVFIDMKRVASAGKLEITAGINSDCPQTALALRTLDEIGQAYPDRLSITFGEVPPRKGSSTEVSLDEIDPSGNRGDAHRAFRSRYQFLDAQRYSTWRGAMPEGMQGSRFEEVTIDAEVTAALPTNGVVESFGFFYVDSAGATHPFNGRQHLLLLLWALENS